MAKKDSEDDLDPRKNRDEDEESAEGKKSFGKKKLIIIAAAVLLIFGGLAGVYFSGILDSKKKTEEAETEAPEATETAEGEPGAEGAKGDQTIVFYDLPEFLVNLNSTGKQPSFLKMTITVELVGGEAARAQVEKMMPRIQDSFNTYTRELRSSDLAGSAGLRRLREELLKRLNKHIYPVVAKDILFKEIIAP